MNSLYSIRIAMGSRSVSPVTLTLTARGVMAHPYGEFRAHEFRSSNSMLRRVKGYLYGYCKY